MNERRDIYLRAHTAKHSERPRGLPKRSGVLVPRWPERVLVFDTETRTDVHQELMFGIYRICKLVDDCYLCESEGVVYSEAITNEELNQIGHFVSNTLADVKVKQFPPETRLQIHRSFPEFMQKVFWPAVRKGWMIVGFNLPFDLSRLSRGWRRSRRAGFRLILSVQLDYKSHTWKPHPYRPEINLDAKDARTTFITRGVPRFRKDEWPNPGRFLDVGTLLFSLFDKHMSLDQWCAEFQRKGYAIERKLDHEPGGSVSQEELCYCRQDVKITQQLLNAAKREFDSHPLPMLCADKNFSPASLAKSYMREMNITPPAEKFKVSDEILGIAMQAYFGGRAEVHIRRTRVPVMRLDFVSQYCTVNTLLRNWEVLTASSVKFPDAIKNVRRLLESIARKPDKCFDREMWPDFRFYALVQPDHDIFPVRAAYNDPDRDRLNIGLNYFSSDAPVWFAGPDIIASILLNGGKVPHILKAIRVLPVGMQTGLRPVRLLGKVRIDPNVDDFYKHVVEQKEANKADPTLKKGLKCVGNAGAYGPLVELNEQKESEDVLLDVYSGDHYHRQTIREREVPGKFYLPPLASLITAGGRLLLALAQKCVEDVDGTYLFCDTDSLCVVADEKGGSSCGGARADLGYVEGADLREFAPIPCLSRDTVARISERFTALNPYSFGGTILKIEDVNYLDEDPRKPFRDLYGYAISAKRYCLFEGKNVRKIVDSKAHGIGYLMNPIQRKAYRDQDQFAAAFWQCVLQNEGISFKGEEPEWLYLPAMMRIPVSSPAVLGRLKDFCKPYDFVLAPIVRDGDFNLDEEAKKPILVTRFEKEGEEWVTATYFNVRTGKPCRITTGEPTSKRIIPVRSYRSVLNAYVNNAEAKFDGPDGKQCCSWTRGMLQRTNIVAGEHRYCGKEFKRKLEQGPVDHEVEFKCKVYENGRVAAGPEALRQLASLSERQISKKTGVHRNTIRLIRHGKGVKRSTYEKVINFLRQNADPAA
jgi:DNA polymerase family B